MKILGLLIASCLLLAACGGGGDGGTTPSTTTTTTPPAVNVTGTWRGSYNSSVFGTQTMTMNLIQTGATVTGTSSSTTGGLGSINGTVSGNTATFTETVTTPGCSGSFNGTAIADFPATGSPTLAFSYNGAASANCGGAESGTGNLTKQ